MKANMKKLLTSVAVAASLGFAASANAGPYDVTIDLFSVGSQIVTDNTNGVSPVANQFGPDLSVPITILGGYRDLIVDADSGADEFNGSKLTVSSGKLSFSNDDGVRGTGSVQWDGDDTGNIAGINYTGLNANLSGKNQFAATVLRADQGFDYSISVYTDENNYSVLSAYTLFAINQIDNPFDPNDQLGPYEATYLFDWFNLASGNYLLGGLDFSILKVGTGVDFSDVGAIEFKMSNVLGQASLDMSIDSIRAVPEPGSMALVGLGLLGLAGLRRRKLPV